MTAALARLWRAFTACPHCENQYHRGYTDGLSKGLNVGLHWGRSQALNAYRTVRGENP